MERVLIATTNKDKFSVVSRIFKETIFPEDKYEILSLSKDMNIYEANLDIPEIYHPLKDDYVYLSIITCILSNRIC